MNRAATSSITASGRHTTLLLSSAFMLLVCGTLLINVFSSSLEKTLSSEKVGKHNNLWSMSFDYSNDYVPPISTVSIESLSELNTKFSVFQYEPGIYSPNKSNEINVLNSDIKVNGFIAFVNDTFFDLFEIQTISGRPPSPTNFEEVAINENFAKTLGIQLPLKEPVKVYLKEKDYIATVVGVVADINYNSSRGKSESIIYAYLETPLQYYYISFEANSLEQATKIVDIFEKRTGSIGKVILTNRTDNIISKNKFYYALNQYSTPIAITIFLVLIMIIFGAIQQTINSRRKELAIRISLGSPITLVIKEMLNGLLLPLIFSGIFGAITSYILGSQLAVAWNIKYPLDIVDVSFVISIHLALILIIAVSITYSKAKESQTKHLRW